MPLRRVLSMASVLTGVATAWGCTSDVLLESASDGGGSSNQSDDGAGADGGTASAPSPTGIPGTFRLTFEEECDGTAVDPTRFRTEMLVGSSTFRSWGERADWMADEQVTVSDGLCVITAIPEPSGDQPFTSGVLNTAGLFEQREGVFEARFRASRGVGLWPTFWLRSVAGWPPAVVIGDLGSETDAVFLGEYWGESSAVVSETEGSPLGAPTAFHTFGLDWSGNTFVYYVDGAEVARHEREANEIAVPLYPTLNLSVADGSSRPAPDETTPWPARMEIDWVRVFVRR